MTKIDSLKKELKVMNELENLTAMLEQTSAHTIARMKTNIMDSRPFFLEVWRIHAILKQLAPPPPEVIHKHLVVVIGIDWGMPGNLLNRVIDEAKVIQKAHSADMLIAGKMAHSRFRDEDDDHTVHFFSAPKDALLVDIQPIYKIIAGYAKIIIVYPNFESISKQNVTTISLSINDKENEVVSINSTTNTSEDIAAKRFIVYPNPQVISNYLNEAVIGLTVHHYFAESILAYSAAQMVAMRNSHDNAKTESKKTKVRYNRARRELIDSKLRELYGSRASHKGNG